MYETNTSLTNVGTITFSINYYSRVINVIFSTYENLRDIGLLPEYGKHTRVGRIHSPNIPFPVNLYTVHNIISVYEYPGSRNGFLYVDNLIGRMGYYPNFSGGDMPNPFTLKRW